MSHTHVRLATAEDLAAVVALYRELRPDDPVMPSELLEARWRDVTDGTHSVVTVACVDGVVAATAMLALVANLASGGRRIGLIEHVVTAVGYRRRGLARQLLEYTLAHAWSADCCKVVLLSGAHRTDAHRVYESVGFAGDVERGFVIKRPAGSS